jgi:hypothetical protein
MDTAQPFDEKFGKVNHSEGLTVKVFSNLAKDWTKVFQKSKWLMQMQYCNTEEGGSSSQHALQLINIHNHDFSQC